MSSNCAVLRFCYHSYDYRPNWTSLSAIAITNSYLSIVQEKYGIEGVSSVLVTFLSELEMVN